MICPNDNIGMRQVQVESHYGQPIILEQCERCGGIWFDESKLHKVKLGEAERIELSDLEISRNHSPIQKTKLLCLKDKSELTKFGDNYFPKDVTAYRCAVCGGSWFKRGEFIKYQKNMRA